MLSTHDYVGNLSGSLLFIKYVFPTKHLALTILWGISQTTYPLPREISPQNNDYSHFCGENSKYNYRQFLDCQSK